MTTMGSDTVSKKSLLRIMKHSSTEGMAECTENTADIADDEKNCTNTSKIPRPTMTASYSCSESLKSNQSNGKTKQAPSMIPRSISSKQTESDQVKPNTPPKTESVKDQLSNDNSKTLNVDVAVSYSKEPADEALSKSPIRESKNFGQKLLKITSSLKFCQDFIDVMRKVSDICREPKEDSSEKNSSAKIPKTIVERNEFNEEKTIMDVYETIKLAIKPSFDNLRRISETEMSELYAGDAKMCETLQEHYEFTLKEIWNIWKNTIGLIAFVKDHIIQFVEGNSKLVDAEQLVLESEMLQLSVDLAINYSKLKADSLVKLAKKRLNVKKVKKTELENFMDSKAFSFTYSDEDLAAMAGTLKDLNITLVKGEELEL